LKKIKTKTTNRFLKDFPSGIHMLNVMDDRYYYFDKRKSGKIAWGVFRGWEFDEEHWTEWGRPAFMFDRETKITYKLREGQ
jgi:hypothetical protein